MSEISEILLALIEQTPWIAATIIIHLVSKRGYTHFLCIFKDVFKIKFDK